MDSFHDNFHNVIQNVPIRLLLLLLLYAYVVDGVDATQHTSRLITICTAITIYYNYYLYHFSPQILHSTDADRRIIASGFLLIRIK